MICDDNALSIIIYAIIPGLLYCAALVIYGRDVKEGGVLPLQLLDAEVLHALVAAPLIGHQTCVSQPPVEPYSLDYLNPMNHPSNQHQASHSPPDTVKPPVGHKLTSIVLIIISNAMIHYSMISIYHIMIMICNTINIMI